MPCFSAPFADERQAAADQRVEIGGLIVRAALAGEFRQAAQKDVHAVDIVECGIQRLNQRGMSVRGQAGPNVV